MKVFISFCLLVSLGLHSEEQVPEASPVPSLPGNEILLFDVTETNAGTIILSAGKNITNQSGYDSQPRFSHDGKSVFYTHAVVTGSEFQMDIYQYDLKSQQTKPYLVTVESEYSPTPLLNGNGLSVVQVDAQGDQYLVLLNNQAEKSQQAQRYSDLKQVGYFNWTADGDLWSFILNDGKGDLYLQGKDLKAEKLSAHIGRSFITDANHQQLYYVDKNTTPWRIKSRAAANKAAALDVMALPMGVEDFTLDSKGRFWAGRDNTLYLSADQKRWYIVHEFSDPTLHQITRVTTNPQADKIAIVFAEKTNTE